MARYPSDAEALRFNRPRTAAILDRIAECYEAVARRKDESAKQRDWPKADGPVWSRTQGKAEASSRKSLDLSGTSKSPALNEEQSLGGNRG